MKIVAIDPLTLFPEHSLRIQSLGIFTAHKTPPPDTKALIERMKGSDIVLDYWADIPKEAIEACPDLKMICSTAAGYDWIDYKTAINKGILVTHCSGHNAQSVAEYTVGLIISSLRVSFKGALEARHGEFNPENLKGKDLYGKTVGVIGYGHVGKKVARILEKGFDVKILYINSKSTQENLEYLLKHSDIISINAPINDTTRNLLSKKEFDFMKEGVVIVNTGRGAVMNEDALIENLKSGKVFAAGLDVLSQEPFDVSNPLFQLDNAFITPHQAYNTFETDYRLSEQVVQIVEAFVQGNPIHIIPEQILANSHL